MITTIDMIKMLLVLMLSERRLRISGTYSMKRIDLITNIKLRLDPLETKSVEENKNALLFKKKLVLKLIKLMPLEKMPIICNMN